MKETRAIAALRALCGMPLNAEVLIPAVLEALHGVVPSYRNLFDWTDEHGQLLRYFIEGPIDAQIAQLYFDQFHNRREVEAMPRFDALRGHPPGVRGADELQHAGFYGSTLYNEIWRPQGFHTRLEGVLRGQDGRLIGSLVLYRQPGDPHFTREERQRLAAVLPVLAAGLQACAPDITNEPVVRAPDAPEFLLMSPQGAVCHATAGAHRLLLMAEGGASRASLSKPLDVLAGRLIPLLLARLRQRGHEGLAPSAALAPSITHETPCGQFVASGYLLQPLQPGSAPLVQITLRRLEPHRVALERALHRLPLTPGQIAVCRGLYQGQPKHHIAQSLGVATSTVVDHARKIYQALDLRSVTGLRAALDERIG